MAKKVVKTSKFNYIGETFINLYSKENPMLTAGDQTYFLFSNVSDGHRKVIGKGTVRVDKYLDSMNKVYWIELEEIMEPDNIIIKYLFNKKTILFNAYNGNEITISQKVFFMNPAKMPNTDPNFFKENLIQIDCFFARSTYEEILALQLEYMQVVRADLHGQIDDINDLLLEHGIS